MRRRRKGSGHSGGHRGGRGSRGSGRSSRGGRRGRGSNYRGRRGGNRRGRGGYRWSWGGNHRSRSRDSWSRSRDSWSRCGHRRRRDRRRSLRHHPAIHPLLLSPLHRLGPRESRGHGGTITGHWDTSPSGCHHSSAGSGETSDSWGGGTSWGTYGTWSGSLDLRRFLRGCLLSRLDRLHTLGLHGFDLFHAGLSGSRWGRGAGGNRGGGRASPYLASHWASPYWASPRVSSSWREHNQRVGTSSGRQGQEQR